VSRHDAYHAPRLIQPLSQEPSPVSRPHVSLTRGNGHCCSFLAYSSVIPAVRVLGLGQLDFPVGDVRAAVEVGVGAHVVLVAVGDGAGDDGSGGQIAAVKASPRRLGLPHSTSRTASGGDTTGHLGVARVPSRQHRGRVLCNHLAGEPENHDQVENTAVTWAPIERLTDFIPAKHIYPPILDALGAAHA
jgi:hypothetical protein